MARTNRFAGLGSCQVKELFVVFCLALGTQSFAQDRSRCADSLPPNVWTVKSSYPFQAGSEATYNELYRGLWKTGTDLVLRLSPAHPRSVGTIKAGALVHAMAGETIVRNPIALIAQREDQVVSSSDSRGTQVATMHKGDLFWVLDSGNEGGFNVWWHCTVVGWDSTSPQNDNPLLLTLGSNEERWVKIRESKTGLAGWFQFDGTTPQLLPAHPTQKEQVTSRRKQQKQV